MDAHSRPRSSYVRLGVETLRDPRAVSPEACGRSSRDDTRRWLKRSPGPCRTRWALATRRIGLGGPCTSRRPSTPCRSGASRRTVAGTRRVQRTGAHERGLRVQLPRPAVGPQVVLDPRIKSTYFARPTLRALAEQYFRYGWWKAQMLRAHPKSLRWRQAVPAAFVATILGLGSRYARVASRRADSCRCRRRRYSVPSSRPTLVRCRLPPREDLRRSTRLAHIAPAPSRVRGHSLLLGRRWTGESADLQRVAQEVARSRDRGPASAYRTPSMTRPRLRGLQPSEHGVLLVLPVTSSSGSLRCWPHSGSGT